MPRMLYIESSPRKQRSHSIAAARAFEAAYHSAHPDVAVDTWDLWAQSEQLPEFDGAAITARYAAHDGATQSPPEAEAWAGIGRSVERLKAADILLFSTPMWNFGVPYKLKHLIDVVTQPGLTVRFDPATGGFTGLIPAKVAVVVSARGGAYAGASPWAPMDMEAPYLQKWLNFIGVADVRHIYVEPTSAGDPAAARAKAVAEAQALAETLCRPR